MNPGTPETVQRHIAIVPESHAESALKHVQAYWPNARIHEGDGVARLVVPSASPLDEGELTRCRWSLARRLRLEARRNST